LRGVENSDSDQAAAFVIEDDTVISDLTVGGSGFVFEVNVQRIGFFVIVQPHMSFWQLYEMRDCLEKMP